jgi:hypothetical protein
MAKPQTKSPEAQELPLVRKTPRMRRIEVELGRDIRLIIKDLYDLYGSITMVANELGLEQSVISIWCARLGITLVRRPVAEITGLTGKRVACVEGMEQTAKA